MKEVKSGSVVKLKGKSAYWFVVNRLDDKAIVKYLAWGTKMKVKPVEDLEVVYNGSN